MDIAITLTDSINHLPQTKEINLFTAKSIKYYLNFPFEDSAKYWPIEDAVELFEYENRRLQANPFSEDVHEDMARAISILVYHLDNYSGTAMFDEYIVFPFLEMFSKELEKVANEILELYYREENPMYAPEELKTYYWSLRRCISPFNFNMDEEIVPVTDAIFRRYAELLVQKDLVHLSVPDLLFDKKPYIYDDEQAYLAHLLFEE